MDIKQYAQLIKEMRSTQINYFKTKSTTALQNSKALEKEVDKQTNIILSGHQQLSLS